MANRNALYRIASPPVSHASPSFHPSPRLLSPHLTSPRTDMFGSGSVNPYVHVHFAGEVWVLC
jgi:hypothetical protein